MSRIIWCGDAVANTGFAKCSHAACNALHAAGHEIVVLGINHYGSDHTYPYPIYPCHDPLDGARGYTGEDRLPRFIVRYQPDVVIILQDPWNIKSYLDAIDAYIAAVERMGELPPDFKMPIMIAWLAVDAKNQQAGHELNQLDHVVTWVQFGLDELSAGGFHGASSVIPCGVDTSIYKPLDNVECRAKHLPKGVPQDAYIVGVVCRNRAAKRLDLTIQYFAEWVKQYHVDNAWLFLHVGPTGDDAVDILSLSKYYGISGRVIMSIPQMGRGHDEQTMAEIYNCFDIYMTTSQGEGWNLPAIESMACGISVIGGDWSGLGAWAKDAALLVPCTSTALNNGTPVPYTIGGIPDKQSFIDELQYIYSDFSFVPVYIKKGLELTSNLTWDSVGKQWNQLVDQIVSTWSSWSMRPNTMDRITIKDVYINNGYSIPDDLVGYVVIDIGANIGAFSRLCLEHGVDFVLSFEPDIDNFNLLEINTKSFPNVVGLFCSAVVGDMCVEDSVNLSSPEQIGSRLFTGGQNIFQVVVDSKHSVPVVKISEVFDDMLNRYDQIILKLDCEGSEYQILFSDLPWDRIELIVGESHPICPDHPFKLRMQEMGLGAVPTDHESLVKRLESVGYDVETIDYYRDGQGFLNFRATRL